MTPSSLCHSRSRVEHDGLRRGQIPSNDRRKVLNKSIDIMPDCPRSRDSFGCDVGFQEGCFFERSSSNSGLVAKRSGKCSSYSDKRGQISRLCVNEKPYFFISSIACFALHPSSAMR